MDSVTLEQSVVDYLYLVGHADSATRIYAWDILRSNLNNHPDKTVTDYLGEPDSPLYSPPMLEEYLECLIRSLPPDNLSHMRAEYLLANIRKNKPGGIISDIRLKTGRRDCNTTLHELIAECDKDCIVLFYDPGCMACDELIDRLSMMRSYQYRIIAISITDKAKIFNDDWISARVLNEDELDENFYLPSLPRMYLTTSTGVIIPTDCATVPSGALELGGRHAGEMLEVFPER